jgi:hypothetical protein
MDEKSAQSIQSEAATVVTISHVKMIGTAQVGGQAESSPKRHLN